MINNSRIRKIRAQQYNKDVMKSSRLRTKASKLTDDNIRCGKQFVLDQVRRVVVLTELWSGTPDDALGDAFNQCFHRMLIRL